MSNFFHYSGEGPNPPPGVLPRFKVGDLVRYEGQIWKVFGIRWCIPTDGSTKYFRYDIRKGEREEGMSVSENFLEPIGMIVWDQEGI